MGVPRKPIEPPSPEQAAFLEQAIEQYGKATYNFAYRLTHNEADARDLTSAWPGVDLLPAGTERFWISGGHGSRGAVGVSVGRAGVGARGGLNCGDHGHAQQLVEGEQGPYFLLEARLVTRAQDVTIQEGVAQGEVGGLDLPARA